MQWRKIGKVFCPANESKWLHSHATMPIAENIAGDVFRVYFSSRDSSNRSYTGFIILDIERPSHTLDIASSPVLSPGNLGEFDDSGAMASWIVRTKDTNFLYYIGWNLGVTVPFRNSIGLAVGNNARYSRYAAGPIIDRSVQEPHFCASCCVVPDENTWKIWYLSCTEWWLISGKPRHRYHIKYAESPDGINWIRKGTVAIDYANEKEYAISRPCVVRDADCWKMWYSYRGDSYRIGYAESENGKTWIRRDHCAGIDVSVSGWDSEMIEYPFVFDHKGQRYMLYNGNGYGKTGFGLAVLE